MNIYPLLTPFISWYTTLMKLSTYARQIGVTYKTARRWWKRGKLDAHQLETGTIVVRQSDLITVTDVDIQNRYEEALSPSYRDCRFTTDLDVVEAVRGM
jgi:hypothetical protein